MGAPYSDFGLPGILVFTFIIAFLIGASSPQVAPLSRSRLVGIIDPSFPHPSSVRIMNAAMAYESAADEIVFVFGPVIVGLLAFRSA